MIYTASDVSSRKLSLCLSFKDIRSQTTNKKMKHARTDVSVVSFDACCTTAD